MMDMDEERESNASDIFQEPAEPEGFLEQVNELSYLCYCLL